MNNLLYRNQNCRFGGATRDVMKEILESTNWIQEVDIVHVESC